MLFVRNDIKGIQLHPDTFQLFMLIFADDIALMSDTVKGLQSQLNVLSEFCDTYILKVNENKTKMLFSKKVMFKPEMVL